MLSVSGAESVAYYDMQVLDTNNYVCEHGFIHHNSGKTQAAVLRAIIGKLQHPETDRGFYEPTYDLIRMIAFPRFEEMLTGMNIPYRLYKSPLNYLEIHGYGKIFFRSMDSPERIIGYEHGDCDIDELDTLKTEDAAKAFMQILARNRQKKRDGSPNTIGVTTTPEGFRFTYEAWAKDAIKSAQNGYVIYHAPTYSNPHLPADYVDSLKSIYPENLLDAYIEGRFVNLTSGTVFNGYERFKCRSVETIKEGEPLKIGMDFNVTNMSAVVYVERQEKDSQATWHAVDELKGIYDTPAMITAIKERYGKRHVTVYPDASGKSRKTVDASISDIALLEKAGFSVRAKDANPPVKDRVTSANACFSHGRVFVNDEKCPEFARCLEQLAYDKSGLPDKKSNLDHLPDAGTYPLAYEFPIRKPVANITTRFAI